MKKVVKLHSVLLTIFITAGFEPAMAQQWQPIAPMLFPREEAAAVTLLDGRVLVAGGNDGTNALSSCELYDPNTNTWSMTGSMTEPRWRYPMVRLLDGRVLVAGGITGPVTDNTVSTTAGCELYDPKTGQWQSVAKMSEASENFPLLVLPNGKVFINGGLDANFGNYVATSEFFDPTTNSIQELTPMLIPYFGQIPFYDSIHNQILIQGGSNGGLQGLLWNTTQVYDIASDTWSYGPSSLAAHDSYTYTVMPDNSLICLGGRTASYEANDTIEVLRPPYQSWQLLGHLTSPRWHGAVVRVTNDSVLVIGGNNDPGINANSYDSTNWFVYSKRQTIQGPRMIQKRSVFVTAVTEVSSGCSDSTLVLAIGGLSNGRVLDASEKLVVNSSLLFPYSQRLHRESASAYFGAVDTLPLAVDISSAINLDSLWPYLTGITATYAWDSSVATYAGYQAPNGWTLTSLASHGNSVDIGIQNGTATASNPLDLGTALFRPHTKELATSWVTLPILQMEIGGQPVSLCVTDNEDSHWAVKTLGVPSGVSLTPAPLPEGEGLLYPNPAGDEVLVRNPGDHAEIVALYDAIGRVVMRASIAAGVTGLLDVHSVSPGMYIARIQSGQFARSQVIVKR